MTQDERAYIAIALHHRNDGYAREIQELEQALCCPVHDGQAAFDELAEMKARLVDRKALAVSFETGKCGCGHDEAHPDERSIDHEPECPAR